MKIYTLFLATLFIIPGTQAATASPATVVVTKDAASKKLALKSNAILALKAATFAGLGYYLGSFGFGYLNALVKMLPQSEWDEINKRREDIFNRAIGPTIGVVGVYAMLYATGNLSQFNEDDIDAGFMGGASAGRDTAAKAA